MLEVKDLNVKFPTRKGIVKAVNGLSLSLKKGEILGIVGESGSGKSMTLMSLMGLVPHPGRTQGSIVVDGIEVLSLSKGELRRIRGKVISMIFQDPMTTLNPVFPVGKQITETLRVHNVTRKESRGIFGFSRGNEDYKRAVQLMEEVGIPSPGERFYQYPHEFSGGMQQRALIAIALACNPKILLADEPTTALDVTVQAQILDLMENINKTHGTSIIFVTHDLGVASQFCHRIMVMYAGRMVEMGTVDQVLENPKHPYTQGLLSSIPHIGSKGKKIKPIPGNVPELINLPGGCAFYERCEKRMDQCQKEVEILELNDMQRVRCKLYMGRGEVIVG
jgi:peptide/nickel transport system ATP-binding protein/oligopeptide transport system ATP-binding protein